MNVEEILQRLEKVKRYNQRSNSWVACCPAHDDRSPSLSVKALDDGRILLHCFGGCDVEQILSALGVSMSDLMGEQPTEYQHQANRSDRIPLGDMLRAMAYSGFRIALMAARMGNGHELTAEEKAALTEMSRELNFAVDYIQSR
ncbi:MAG: CHC2 zinc finger domain-containing protein [Betaproteobacteria bacterium]